MPFHLTNWNAKQAIDRKRRHQQSGMEFLIDDNRHSHMCITLPNIIDVDDAVEQHWV